MYSTCIKKQEKIKQLFLDCSSAEEKYLKIIELGKKCPSPASQLCTFDRLVNGCQSQVYLITHYSSGSLKFEACSDALISSGLAALLILAYNYELPETILKCPPTFIKDLGIAESLTPSRANGLYSIYLRMKQEALKYLTTQK